VILAKDHRAANPAIRVTNHRAVMMNRAMREHKEQKEKLMIMQTHQLPPWSLRSSRDWNREEEEVEPLVVVVQEVVLIVEKKDT